MKKLFVLFAMVIMMHSATSAAAVPHTMSVKVSGHGKRYTASVYWRDEKIASYKFSRKPMIRIVESDKLTSRMLTTRKNKVLYIEYFVGKQINKEGDGRIDTNRKYNYVSYKRSGFHKGDKIRTYCVYNPHTNYEDDISERYDELVD